MNMSGRTIGVVTSARADFGLLRDLMAAIASDEMLSLVVFATGMHHSVLHGETIREVRAAGLGGRLVEVESWEDGDSPTSAVTAMGRGLSAFGAAFGEYRPDVLVVLGDRYDMVPAVLAALPFTIPVAHISGGEITEGAIDDAIRHAVTKMAHLHFPSTEDFAARICQMGEEPWRVTVTGQPGLDRLAAVKPGPRAEVLARYGLSAERPVTLFTFHPETLSFEDTPTHITHVLAAARQMDTQILFTAPNADPGNQVIRDAIDAFVGTRPDCIFRESLGATGYAEMLHHAQCMVGNSSSGLIEAASIPIPAVNIGERQAGRLAPANVLSCPLQTEAVAEAWRHALDPAFRASLAGMVNPYGDGHAIRRIVARLREVPLGPSLIRKRFVETPPVCS